MNKGVITGDVVNSTSIPIGQRADLLASISNVMDDIKRVVPLEYEIFRGDSIQIVVKDPSNALLAGVLLRAGIKGMTPKEADEVWDIRISIGIGQVEFLADNISISDGEAFRLSGRGLDEMGKGTLCVKTPWEGVNDELDVNIPFVDDIIYGWSSSQARVMFMALLEHRTKKEIGVELGQTHQNVSKQLIAAKEKLIRNSLDRFAMIINSKNEPI